ncbi:TRAP transporter substrate-binding protein [Virgibacillus ainsalahensis]
MLFKNKLKAAFTSFVLIGVIGLVGCEESASGTGGSSDGDQVVIRMANQVEQDNFLNQGYVEFKEYIEENSDGEVAVEIHNGGTITNSDESIVELLDSGSLELSTSSAYGVANVTNVKGFNLFDMPFLFDDREEFYSFIDGPYGDQLAEQVSENTNVEVLGFVDLGFYSLMNGKKPVETPEDLNGLTIRSSEADLHLDTLKSLGANPTPMAYSEVFTGLQQGTIDGVSTTTPLIYGDRFFEVNKNITLTNHILLPHILMVNKDFYNSLSADVQELLDEAVQEYIKTARELAVEAEKEAVNGLADEGVEVIELSPEQKEEFRKATESVREANIEEVGEENYNKAMDLLGK